MFQRVRFGGWREEELLQVRGAEGRRPRGRGAGRARGRSARAEARAVLASSRDCSEDDGLVLQPGKSNAKIFDHACCAWLAWNFLRNRLQKSVSELPRNRIVVSGPGWSTWEATGAVLEDLVRGAS